MPKLGKFPSFFRKASVVNTTFVRQKRKEEKKCKNSITAMPLSKLLLSSQNYKIY